MFSILGSLDGISFLDLFAGSGIVALEAASRGARRIVLVEKDRKKRRTILDNLKIAADDPDFSRCGEIELVMRPAERFLSAGMERFGIVHCDPPFAMSAKERLLKLADKAGQPSVGGTLMIHHPSDDQLPKQCGNLARYDQRRYGQSVLAFYTREN